MAVRRGAGTGGDLETWSGHLATRADASPRRNGSGTWVSEWSGHLATCADSVSGGSGHLATERGHFPPPEMGPELGSPSGQATWPGSEGWPGPQVASVQATVCLKSAAASRDGAMDEGDERGVYRPGQLGLFRGGERSGKR